MKLFSNIFFLILLFGSNTIVLSQYRFLYVGSYSDDEGKGLYVLKFNMATGDVSSILETYNTSNPSFLAISHNRKYLYAVNENKAGSVSAYKIQKRNGALKLLNVQSSLGEGPCHLVTDYKDNYCIIGHYGSGDISLLPINYDGTLDKATLVYQYQEFQNSALSKKPRVHSINIASNNKDIYVPDLGLDQILHFKLSKNGAVVPGIPGYTSLPDGSGPRHFTFHPTKKLAYCISEYSSKISVYDITKSGLKEKYTYSTLPDDFLDKNYCADIQISADGKYLYGSNRGHNSIVIFKVDFKTGQLHFAGHQSSLGEFPRNFVIDPSDKYLLVANQKSNNIQVFKRDTQTGLLSHLKEIKNINKPVCLKFL